MKILAALSDYYGTSYFRQIVPYSRLGDKHQVIFTDVIDDPIFKSADVVMTRLISTPPMLELIKRLKDETGIPIIMDIDDNVHSLHADNYATIMYSTGKQGTKIFEEALRLVDYVSCSTHRLAEEYKKFRKDFHVLENFMPTQVYEKLSPAKIDGKPKREGEIRIGGAWSSSHAADLAIISKPLKKLCKRYPQVKVVVFGQGAHINVSDDQIEYHEYVDAREGEQHFDFMARYFDKLKSLDLDIALAPIIPSIFNACKSFLKVLEYGSCGYPVIASNYGPYKEYRGRAGPIFTVFDEEGWYRNMCLLVEDETKRRDMAEVNHLWIGRHHTTEAGLRPWLALLQEVEQSLVQGTAD